MYNGNLFMNNTQTSSHRPTGMFGFTIVWIGQIISAVEEENASIVKVRAGYILSERLGIADPRIEAWKAFAQRGGSRKLDPDAPYAPVFSGAWMLSLNV